MKELRRDVKGPTLKSLANLKHLLIYLSGNKLSVLRLRPSQTLSGWKCILDTQCSVDSVELDVARPENLLQVALFKSLVAT